MTGWFTLAVSVCALSTSLFAQDGSFSSGTKEDEAAIRQIVTNAAAGKPDPRIASDLDWENAFGIRYESLTKRNAFDAAKVTPSEKDDTESTLEVKVRFIAPDVAVADQYWHIVGPIDRSPVDNEKGKPGLDRWGRTTYVFKKRDGVWTELLERVADLRMPYYKHFEKLPDPFPVSAETLESYAGAYESARGKRLCEVKVMGDRLQMTSRLGLRVAIPASATEFFAFSPDDLAQYLQLRFSKEPTGSVRIDVLEAWGEKILDGRKSE